MAESIDALLARLYHPDLKTIEPGLERVKAFLALLGAPQEHIPPVIHVAGTNGKGSLIAYLQGIFEAAGYNVHRYISPHLVRFNERIVIAGRPIDDDYLRHLLETIWQRVAQQPVTFFEATTAAAFLAFSENPGDIVLLETGMGGRLDATNVVDAPLLTAITPVSLDHCAFLGDTIGAIAGEKAGILKHGVPCVVGRQDKAALEIIETKAQRVNAPLYRFGHEFEMKEQGHYSSASRDLLFKPSLAGAHQYDNAATAIACIDRLTHFTISDRHVQQGLKNADWPGRLQPLTTGRYAQLLPPGIELWLDGGHNPQGAGALAVWFEQKGIGNIYIICGMVQGKDTEAFMNILAPQVSELYAVTIPGEASSLAAEALEMAAKSAGIKAQKAVTIENALQTIVQHAKTPSIICICGSLYLAGKVLAANEKD